ncbi:hypothetical protein BO83DRAFT_394520 [Aspergillus eucalypticola CBS 122712]|uniref:Zn(2)-C6 fungal-type domain-containing protein n=1 Tax=Aspergillus eucalypticola (strain CBS 122712 / IBT 29274) TaxID=1448314 RepID=A0A317UK74_ASPEC|nr:uncharacterized protein BO83DRAFT_394520 [Aspergillus eucalypticola CBS 122712]PWY61719.1 hypothetical protein BO83DRAFT_394520 [Aspergillus eucalypticola CBS 122712]
MAPPAWALLPSWTTAHPRKLLIPRARAHIQLPNSSSGSRTTQACDSCRSRKAKCDGAKPKCTNCEGRATECVYSDQNKSKQRRELDKLRNIIQHHDYMIRTILSQSLNTSPSTITENPEHYSRWVRGATHTVAHQENSGDLENALQALKIRFNELNQIYEAIRKCDPDTLPSMVSAIRHSTSVHDAATRLMRQVPIQRPGLGLEDMQQAWTTQLSGQPDLLERQTLYSVNTIGLWSDQIDNSTASHLFSLYFVWDNPTWGLIEPSLFLNHLNNRDTRFCSSLLVHTILFYACSSLLLGVFFCAMGRDKIGVRYIQYGALMALQLGLHTSSAEAFRVHREPNVQQYLRMHKILACAVYDLETMSAQVSGRSSVWSAPPEIFLGEDEARAMDLDQEWTPYPFKAPVYRPYMTIGAWARRTLLIIVNDVAQLYSPPGVSTDQHLWQRAATIYQRLNAFRQTLPAELEIATNKSPHNICLQYSLYYYATVVNLCGMFRACPPSPSEDCPIESADFNPHKILGEAMESMGRLVLLYRACHGWKSTPVVMMHYFFIVGVRAASRLECPKWREILASCVAGLWHMSLVWRLCRALLRMIELVLRSSVDLALVPAEVRLIFDEHREKFWSQEEREWLAANYVIHHHTDQVLGESRGGSDCFHGKGLETVIREFDQESRYMTEL